MTRFLPAFCAALLLLRFEAFSEHWMSGLLLGNDFTAPIKPLSVGVSANGNAYNGQFNFGEDRMGNERPSLDQICLGTPAYENPHPCNRTNITLGLGLYSQISAKLYRWVLDKDVYQNPILRFLEESNSGRHVYLTVSAEIGRERLYFGSLTNCWSIDWSRKICRRSWDRGSRVPKVLKGSVDFNKYETIKLGLSDRVIPQSDPDHEVASFVYVFASDRHFKSNEYGYKASKNREYGIGLDLYVGNRQIFGGSRVQIQCAIWSPNSAYDGRCSLGYSIRN